MSTEFAGNKVDGGALAQGLRGRQWGPDSSQKQMEAVGDKSQPAPIAKSDLGRGGG